MNRIRYKLWLYDNVVDLQAIIISRTKNYFIISFFLYFAPPFYSFILSQKYQNCYRRKIIFDRNYTHFYILNCVYFPGIMRLCGTYFLFYCKSHKIRIAVVHYRVHQSTWCPMDSWDRWQFVSPIPTGTNPLSPVRKRACWIAQASLSCLLLFIGVVRA